MKKSNLIKSIISLITGLSLIIPAIKLDSYLGGSLFGISGALVGFGIVGVYNYFKWSRPENREEYETKVEEANRSAKDERLIALRDKSGRYAYIFGLITMTISIWILMILRTFNIIADNKILFIFTSGYLILQFISGFVFFNYLVKKY